MSRIHRSLTVLLALPCLLLPSASPAQITYTSESPRINSGEIELEGKPVWVDPAQGLAVLEVTLVTTPDGTAANYDNQPRQKQIRFSGADANTLAERLLEAMRTGAKVRVVGPNSGTGTTMSVRVMTLVSRYALPTPQATPSIEHPYEGWASLRAASTPQAEEALGAAVLSFCEKNLGRRVGSGQCAALAESALRFVGAHPRFADYPSPLDYTWGRFVYSAECQSGHVREAGSAGSIRPGDIIQFRDVVLDTVAGRWSTHELLPHHTAIVESIGGDGRTCNVLQENAGGVLYVTRGEYRLSDLKAGWFRVYRPVPMLPQTAMIATPLRGVASTAKSL